MTRDHSYTSVLDLGLLEMSSSAGKGVLSALDTFLPTLGEVEHDIKVRQIVHYGRIDLCY